MRSRQGGAKCHSGASEKCPLIASGSGSLFQRAAPKPTFRKVEGFRAPAGVRKPGHVRPADRQEMGYGDISFGADWCPVSSIAGGDIGSPPARRDHDRRCLRGIAGPAAGDIAQ